MERSHSIWRNSMKMMRELQPYVALWREARKEEAAAVAM
jgi:hypothetical protein